MDASESQPEEKYRMNKEESSSSIKNAKTTIKLPRAYLFREAITDWISSTTAHGFPNLVRPTRLWRKLVWALLIIAVIGYVIYIIITYLITFMEQKTNTSIYKVYEPNHEFPVITICNLNPFDTYSLSTYNYLTSLLMSQNLQMNATAMNMSANELMNVAMKILRNGVVNEHKTNQISDDFLKGLGFSIETLIVSCYYMGVACSASNFEYSRNYVYGNCYTFSPLGKESQRSTSGPNSGLELELFTGIPGVQDSYSFEKGVYVLINNKTVDPALYTGGVSVPTGTRTNIAITKTTTVSFSTKSQPCRSEMDVKPDDSIYYSIVKNSGTYERDFCRDMYIQIEYMIKKCGCLASPVLAYDTLSEMYNVRLCMNATQRACENQVKIGCKTLVVSDADCPRKCESTKYSSNLNSASYPSMAYCGLLQTQKDALNKFTLPTDRSFSFNVNDASFMMSFMIVSIYFEEPWYTHIETSLQITVDTLVGLVGGILGLSGISFLTITETWFLFFDFIRIIIFRKYNRN